MKKTAGIIGRAVGILAAGVLLGTLLLTVSFMIPVNAENVRSAKEVLDKEGWYPVVPTPPGEEAETVNQYLGSFLPGVLDNCTDTMMVSIASHEVQDHYLYHAMNMYSSFQDFNYSRYWHGYVAILRPLFLVFDYSEIRLLNGICQLGLIFALTWLVGKRKGFAYVCALLTMYLLLMPMAVSLNFQYSWVFYVGILGSIFLVGKANWCRKNHRYLYVFLLLGMLTSFLDLLTYPLFAWGIPMVCWLMAGGGFSLEKGTKKALDSIRHVVLGGIFWIGGYGGMWVMKWCVAGAVLGRNVFGEAMGNVLGWSGIVSTYEGGFSRRLGAVSTNWQHYGYGISVLLFLVWLVYFVVRSCKRGFRRSSLTGAVLLTGLSSLVWFFMIDNHTIEHHFFAYRNYSVAILAFLVWMLEISSGQEEKQTVVCGGADKQGAARYRRAAGWLGLSLICVVPRLITAGKTTLDSGRTVLFYFETWLAVGTVLIGVMGECLCLWHSFRRRKTTMNRQNREELPGEKE